MEVETSKIPAEFEFKTKPFNHQVVGVEFGLTHDKWFLGDTMGLGKTKCAIDLACIKKLEKGYKHCLIICGVNSLKWNWVNEVRLHSHEDAYILGQRGVSSLYIKGNKNKLEDMKAFDGISQYFIITNIETLRNAEIVAELKRRLQQKDIEMIVLDEAHMCKNPSSQQGKGILNLKAETMIAMTGTPLMNSPLDLYMILRWLGYEQHSYYQFKNHYCIMGGYGDHEVVGYKNLNQLESDLKKIMLRRRKEDVLDLPEKIYVDEYVDMTLKQSQIYRDIQQMVKANIDKILLSPNPLTELIRLRQATGYTGILSTSIRESAKLDRMEELVEEAVLNNQKVVIFSNWTQMTTPILDRLSTRYQCAKITGENSTEERQRAMDRFQTDPNCKVIVGTIGAMGTGINLTAATVEIFVDEPWNEALKDQAVDRCHRIGALSNITIYTLMCKDTIDERIHSILKRKSKLSDVIVDNLVIDDKKELVQFLIN